MNKITLFVSVALLLAAGCAKETDQTGRQSLVKVGVSLADIPTRTYLGETTPDGKREVCWSKGDVINLNGTVSLPLTEEQAGRPVADFLCYNEEFPRRVIYPASICEGSTYAEDGSITINIPSVQEYSESSFGKGAAILYGYSDASSVALNNLCGAVQVIITGQQDITKAALISNDSKVAVAGKYSLNPETGEYAVLEGQSSIMLDITEITLTPEKGQSFYFTLPYGEYPEGFTVKFYSGDFPMECLWLSNSDQTKGVTIQAGTLYQFNPVVFTPGKKEILTGAEWNYIATQINAGNDDWKAIYLDEKTNTIKLGADITLGDDAVKMQSFEYTLDGNGFSIINQNASRELVYQLPKGGKIMNLTLKGKMTSGSDMSVLVHTVAGGTIENCVNEMDVELGVESDLKSISFGAMARKITFGTIRGCVNKGDFNITITRPAVPDNATKEQKEQQYQAFCGGIVANVYRTKTDSVDGRAIIEDCINEGNINIVMKLPKTYGFSRAGFGGIAGYIHDEAGSEDLCLISNCVNRGDIRIDIAAEKAVGYEPKTQTSVGGIVGLVSSLATVDPTGSIIKHGMIDNPISSKKNSYIRIKKCTNEGDISNNAYSRAASNVIHSKVFTGGIAGTVIGRSEKPSEINDCISSGKVTPYSVTVNPFKRAAYSGVCGGMVGLGGYLNISGGKVDAEVGTDEAFSFAVGGVIGTALTCFSISDMTITPALKMIQMKTASKDFTIENYALAFTTNKLLTSSTYDIKGSSISGCSFGGSIVTGVVTVTDEQNPVFSQPSDKRRIEIDAGNFKDYIVSGSYEAGGVTVDDTNKVAGAM